LASAREKRYGGQNTAVVTDRVALKNDIAVYVKNIRRNTSSKYRMVLLFNKTNKTHEFHKFYFVKKLYMFRAFPLPSPGVFYCTFGIGKFHADF